MDLGNIRTVSQAAPELDELDWLRLTGNQVPRIASEKIEISIRL
jgi:hypothetical protein